MNKNKIAMSSLAMDLKRAAIGYYRGSDSMADRFFEEALKRRKEIDMENVKPHIKKLLQDFVNIRLTKDKQKAAEDALMYSTLFQNSSLA